MSARSHLRRAAIGAGLALLVLAPAARAADAPLDPLSGPEIRTAIKAIEASTSFQAGAFFPIVTLKEPPKAAVLAWSPGKPFTREAFANVYEPKSNRLWEAVVDLKASPARVTSFTRKTGVQPAVYGTEYADADTAVRENAGWLHAMDVRNINPDNVYLDVWAPGDVELPPTSPANPPGTRLLRALSFFQRDVGEDTQQPNPYDRPIEGVSVTVAMSGAQGPRVVDVVDTGVRPVNKTISGNADANRPALKPLKIVQPNGPGFTRNGHLVSWQGWRFRVGFNPREGLVLQDIGFDDGGTTRSIIRRMALDEIYVPYGLPDRTWVWRAALDVGEYNLGQYAEPLDKNDVPDNAVFYDEATFNDVGSTGEDPAFFDLPNAIAMYERPAGSLWDRTDPTSFERDARAGRELVVTSAVVIGNYTYNVEYVFRLDGGIDVVTGATGTTLNRGVADPFMGDAFSTLVAPNIAAPTHQHFFNFRIDFDVDGTNNRVFEENTHGEPSDFNNKFVTDETQLSTEGFRDHSPATSRHWVVESAAKFNSLGTPTGYELEPGDFSPAYSEPNYEPLIHAPFAQHGLWVTQYKDGELFAGGDYPNQGTGTEGLTRFVNGQPLDAKDVVVWYTASFTHVPTVEEFPVMPRETIGFKLRPDGFFDENPALDVPPAG
jgi:primary-amine oxidase